MQVKANEALFNQWHSLAERIKLLAGIVQNDVEMSVSQFLEWNTLSYELTEEMKRLRKITGNYLFP